MRRSTIVLALVAVAAMATCLPASGFPDPLNSTIPGHIIVVARGSNGPDVATGQCFVTVRDLAANPVPGVTVVFDFSNVPDIRLAEDQGNPFLTTDCAAHTVSAVTNQAGVATFTIVGTGIVAPASLPNAVRVYEGGAFLGGISAAVLDRDGVGGLTGNDLALLTADILGGTNPPRADLNGNVAVDGLDISAWAAAFFGGHDVLSADSYCP